MTSRDLVGLPRIVDGAPDMAMTPPLRVAPALAPAPPAAARPIRPRDEFVTAWLLLMLDGGAGYGYELRRRLEAQSISIDSAVVYRTLRRLENEGLVRSHWTESVVGPRRRSYKLSASGTRELDDVAGTIRSLRDLHDRFLGAHDHALAKRRRR